MPSSETSFFDNFTNKLKEQSALALAPIRTAVQEILTQSLPDEKIVNSYKALQKRAKFLDRLLAVYLLNIIIYFVNQILTTGGFVDIIITIPLLDRVTPRGIVILTTFLLGAIGYIFYLKLFTVL